MTDRFSVETAIYRVSVDDLSRLSNRQNEFHRLLPCTHKSEKPHPRFTLRVNLSLSLVRRGMSEGQGEVFRGLG
ncbi:MAG: hypothetical protein ICV78_03080 [Tolypothrix sp. Co-bin9]|nr:hypothetical protein [Tolypothrix sp. Co-bin9]